MRNFFHRFIRNETAAVTVEYIIWWPIYLAFFAGVLEYGYMNMRSAMLERGVSKTVREIRLDRDHVQDHAGIVKAICFHAGILTNCEQNLRVEMIRTSVENFTAPPARMACVDRSQEFDADEGLNFGQPDDIMLLRVCAKFKALAPTTYFTSAVTKDSNGEYALASQNAFVVEPR